MRVRIASVNYYYGIRITSSLVYTFQVWFTISSKAEPSYMIILSSCNYRAYYCCLARISAVKELLNCAAGMLD